MLGFPIDGHIVTVSSGEIFQLYSSLFTSFEQLAMLSENS